MTARVLHGYGVQGIHPVRSGAAAAHAHMMQAATAVTLYPEPQLDLSLRVLMAPGDLPEEAVTVTVRALTQQLRPRLTTSAANA